ncbi:MAG: DUF262 domain-containing protein [Syntrophales bacterium]
MNPDKIKVSIGNYYEAMFSGDRHFFMPQYQRPYSWDRKQIEDFWNDLVFAIEEARDLPYLLGSIYLAKVSYSQLGDYINPEILAHERLTKLSNASDLCFVIDGQQRATTFFLFLLAFQDPEFSLHLFQDAVPKLIPGIVDFEYFFYLVAQREIAPKTMSNRRIKATYDYFYRRLSDFPRRDEMKHFVKQNLQVVQILVEDDLELAGTLFVSQTDRGKRLTNLEKLKSTLIFYAQKIEGRSDKEEDVDNLFGALFVAIERLCSLRVYPKPENAEADVLRILNFILLRERFYKNYLNDLIVTEDDKDRKVDIWYESGEDRIYESINKVFRESLVIQKDNIQLIIPYLAEKIKHIIEFFNYLANVAIPRERTNVHKDPYGNKTWYPFKQLFNILGLSVFSKALLAEIHRNTLPGHPSLLEPGNTTPKKEELTAVNLFEEIDRIKGLNSKLAGLTTDKTPYRDIELLRPYKELFAYLAERYRICLLRIDQFKQFTVKPATLFNFIEENELAIWSIGKRPVGSFVWETDNASEIVAHIRDFSYGYKKEYLVRDLAYGNYKYVLYEYERLTYNYTDEDLNEIFDFDVDEEDGIMIQREHIFAQGAVNYQELKDTWLKTTNENYDDWMWKIGNIALLEHTINIGNAGNKCIWEKADYYEQSHFKGTKAVADEIKYLKKLIDESVVSTSDTDHQIVFLLPFKILLEIRELELLAFTFYRFA